MKKAVLLCAISLLAICGYAQKVCSSVCGIDFGKSYYNVSTALHNKFGAPDVCDKNTITFYNKAYSGVFFDVIMFGFQYDINGTSHFNSCTMGSSCKSLAEATDKMGYYAERLSEYDMKKYLLESGEFYCGGVSPTNKYEFGVDVETMESEGTIYAIIHYGPYDYVGEGF